jgi:hypothetical protein
VKYRTLFLLAMCAAASAAALAHFAIDIVGDYALRHDAYDGLAHGSREYAAALALVFATVAAARGLRGCCDLAQRARGRLAKPQWTARAVAGYSFVALATACVLVPAMEWLDNGLAGVPLSQLDDAFGGSLLLGLSVTLLCAASIAGVLYGLARWLLAHRDLIVAIVATLLHRCNAAVAAVCSDLDLHGLHGQSPSVVALRLAQRGPPVALSIVR